MRSRLPRLADMKEEGVFGHKRKQSFVGLGFLAP